jgi:peptidoglycan/LPS O-acetylase OafA/YrhL
MRLVVLFLALALALVGAYLKFLYDVPDSQESINFFVSGFLLITGIGGALMALLWQSPRKKRGEGDQ